MINVVIKRKDSDEKQTLGSLKLLDKETELFTCHTLELSWKENEKKISCIPKGTYKVIPRWSAKFKHHFHVLDVPNRSYILIHAGNYYTDIEGCILVGAGLADINGDGLLDVTNSKVALNKLLELAPEGFTLTIE